MIPLAIPAVWLALLGLAALLGDTPWGREGHPSNGVILVIEVLLAAPVFGLAGGAYAWFTRKRYSKRIFIAAAVVDAGLVAAGIGFWIVLWFT